MKTVLRGLVTLAPFVAGVALVLALAKRWPWISAVVTGGAIGFVVVGAVWKMWRLAKGDPAPTNQVGWLPRRWQACILHDD